LDLKDVNAHVQNELGRHFIKNNTLQKESIKVGIIRALFYRTSIATSRIPTTEENDTFRVIQTKTKTHRSVDLRP
jgi:hypothetical protein